MSNLPSFAQGARFSIDTTPDPDVAPFHPHTPHPPQRRNASGSQSHGRYGSHAESTRGHFTPRGGYTPRGFSQGHSGSHSTPRHFYDRPRGTQRDAGDYQAHYSARGARGSFRGGPRTTPRSWAPRQPQPNFDNPYENQLTPRQSFASRPRWTHTPRGHAAPSSTQFGPCAKGASQQTLSTIDAFVKPSMLDNPWYYLEQKQRDSSGKSTGGGEPTSKKSCQDVEPDRSPPPANDDVDEEEDADQPGGSKETDSKEDSDEHFNVKDFLPKV